MRHLAAVAVVVIGSALLCWAVARAGNDHLTGGGYGSYTQTQPSEQTVQTLQIISDRIDAQGRRLDDDDQRLRMIEQRVQVVEQKK